MSADEAYWGPKGVYLKGAGWVTNEVPLLGHPEVRRPDGTLHHPSIPDRTFTVAAATAIQQARDVEQYGRPLAAHAAGLSRELAAAGARLVGELPRQVSVDGFRPASVAEPARRLAAVSKADYIEGYLAGKRVFFWQSAACAPYEVAEARDTPPEIRAAFLDAGCQMRRITGEGLVGCHWLVAVPRRTAPTSWVNVVVKVVLEGERTERSAWRGPYGEVAIATDAEALVKCWKGA